MRRHRYPRVVDRFLVPATPEPLITCIISGSAEWRERDVGGTWTSQKLAPGYLFVTRSKVPYEVRWTSPRGEEIEVISIHLAVDHFLAALEATYPGHDDEVEVIDFFGRDGALEHLCLTCAEMLAQRIPGTSKRLPPLIQLISASLVEKYTSRAGKPIEFRGGLPISQLQKVQDYVAEHLAEDISIEVLAGLAELSPFHFSRVFKQTTGMSPLQFVTRERITRAQQLIRETSHSLIEIALEVGYTSPSHFAQVFRRVVRMTPSDFRSAL